DGLAWMYQALGRAAEAEPLLRGNLEIVRRAVGEDHAALAPHLQRLADLSRGLGDDAAAEPLYRQALELLRKDPPKENRPLSGLLNNLALLYLARGKPAQAEPLLRQALENDHQALGEDHPDHASSLQTLAGLCALTGRTAEALALLGQVTALQDRLAPHVVALESGRQRAAFGPALPEDGYKVLPLAPPPGDAEAAGKAFELVLRRKALWVEALARPRLGVLGQRYPKQSAGLRRLQALRRQVAFKTLTGPGNEGLATHQRVLSGWRQECDRLV